MMVREKGARFSRSRCRGSRGLHPEFTIFIFGAFLTQSKVTGVHFQCQLQKSKSQLLDFWRGRKGFLASFLPSRSRFHSESTRSLVDEVLGSACLLLSQSG